MYFLSESKSKSRAWDNDGSSEEQSLPKAKPVREPAAKKAAPGKKNAGKHAKKGQTSRVTTSRSPSVKSLEESEAGESDGEYEVEKLLGALLDDDSQQWGLVSWKGTSDCFFRNVTLSLLGSLFINNHFVEQEELLSFDTYFHFLSIDWLIGLDWLIGVDWLIDWLIGVDWLIDWLVFIDWLIDWCWLIDWLVSIDWLIDWCWLQQIISSFSFV